MPPRVGSQTRVAQVTTPRTTRITQAQSNPQQRPQSVRSSSSNARRGELANYGSQRRQQIQRNAETAGNIVGNVARGYDMNRTFQRYGLEPNRGATVTGIRDTQAGRSRGNPPRLPGEPIIRFDRADRGTNHPHININPNYRNGAPDPHTRISPRTLSNVGRVGRGLEFAGRVARPVAIGVDVARIANAINQDGGNLRGRNVIRTGASVAGGWGGAAAGAWGGAQVGAAFGTIGGPLGIAAGGIIGGFVGGIGGAFVGSWASERAAESVTR
jgi:hypothetical protein